MAIGTETIKDTSYIQDPYKEELIRTIITDVSFISATKSDSYFTQSLADMQRRVFQHANKAIAAKGRLRGFKIGTSAIATVIHHGDKK